MARAYRAQIAYFVDHPRTAGADALVHHRDGGLVVDGGHIVAIGPWQDIAACLPADTEVSHFQGRTIMPGFVDAHVHFPQVDVIASHGAQLMDWLDRYTFPAEMAFADDDHAAAVAEVFLDELLRNGTTSALVFASRHEGATDALFAAAQRRRMRLAAGNVLMDRLAPAPLCTTVEAAADMSERLIRRWHGRERLHYAVTPRFAPSCTSDMLAMAGRLLRDNPGVLMQTHLSENKAEIDLVAELFPDAADYLDVYDRHGLVGDRSVFAHCIHLSQANIQRLKSCGSAVAHCPTSNLFLGSGLFPLRHFDGADVTVALGSDVGAGTSFSSFATMADAYKVSQMGGSPLSGQDAFYMATLGGARALGMEQKIGTFAPGHEADFIVLNPQATPLLARRTGLATSFDEWLFAMMILADDRAVERVYLMGSAAGISGETGWSP